jgi:hypothetical protein
MTTFTGTINVVPLDSQTTVASFDQSGNAYFAGAAIVSGTAQISSFLVAGAKSFAITNVTALTSTQTTAQTGLGSNMGAVSMLRITINGSAYGIPLIHSGSLL